MDRRTMDLPKKNDSIFHLPKDLQIDGTLRTKKMEELKLTWRHGASFMPVKQIAGFKAISNLSLVTVTISHWRYFYPQI